MYLFSFWLAGISGIVPLGEDSQLLQCRALVHKHLPVFESEEWVLNFGNSLPPQLSPRFAPFKKIEGGGSKIPPLSSSSQSWKLLIHRHEIYRSHDTFYLLARQTKDHPSEIHNCRYITFGEKGRASSGSVTWPPFLPLAPLWPVPRDQMDSRPASYTFKWGDQGLVVE